MSKPRTTAFRVLSAALLTTSALVATASVSSANDTLPVCGAETRYIHKSTSTATFGKVKVNAITTCNMVMEEIAVEVILYKEVNGVLVYQGTSPDPVKNGAASINRSAVGADCEPGWYTAQSVHSARLGTFRYADTTSDRRYVNCN